MRIKTNIYIAYLSFIMIMFSGCNGVATSHGGAASANNSAAGLRQGPCGERYSSELGMELSMIRQLLDEDRPRSALAYLEDGGYDFAEAHLLQGDALRFVGDLANSDRAYNRLLDSCLAADAYRGLALNVFQRGELQLAIEVMRRARGLRPTDPRIRNDLGYLLLLGGRHEEAESELETALELDNSHQAAAANLVLTLLRQGRAQRAEQVARRYGVAADNLALLQDAVQQGQPAS